MVTIYDVRPSLIASTSEKLMPSIWAQLALNVSVLAWVAVLLPMNTVTST